MDFYRLLVLVLVENEGALQIASEFSVSGKQQITNKEKLKAFISEVAQVIISIPDKARLRAPPSLSSQYPQPRVVITMCSCAFQVDSLFDIIVCFC